MRRLAVLLGIILLIQPLGATGAQQSGIVGRWEGKIQFPQGERPTNAIFTREGDEYSGKMPGLIPGTEIELKEIKVEGNKITARADVETPQATITINYSFTLDGDTLNGQGSLNFGGQDVSFDISLNRVRGEGQAGDSARQGPGQPQRRQSVPQPQQNQTIDYFVGQWTYRYIGRESPIAPAPRDCRVTFTRRPDGKSLEAVTECTHEGGSFREDAIILYDESSKILTYTERLSNGITLNSRGDWSSPISIRFTIDPVSVNGESLQVRRTISVVAAHSFTVAEELSEDGGPFVRLGGSVVTRVGSN